MLNNDDRDRAEVTIDDLAELEQVIMKRNERIEGAVVAQLRRLNDHLEVIVDRL